MRHHGELRGPENLREMRPQEPWQGSVPTRLDASAKQKRRDHVIERVVQAVQCVVVKACVTQ